MKTVEFEVIKNDFQRQYEAKIEGEILTAEFSEQERKIFLTKLTVPDAYKDSEIQNIFISKILDSFKDTRFKVMPTSPEIAKFFRKNRLKYKDLLPAGISI
ncbi:acetyltransferase, putative [Psychroflexus torquis ATCC 700755]|jgi:predicted GNAT family acetyltransferase|uniref:Acetyltransferase, putative n=1 Tax=Psychroflexus torquis (strain ATCC 700755 / CIP 106069 / ACAM 623) TaxID=313595 RepID=K4IL23_PSYTT|nr:MULTISPECIES: N-acetyltransferase [Psychroflexus]AFU70473.1 acetyltransferase, putative [Psychroflexus torquis ATCC 700755]PKG41734.1 N-acetyltransferase [Psychroflexus sp. MES1-P1E]